MAASQPVSSPLIKAAAWVSKAADAVSKGVCGVALAAGAPAADVVEEAARRAAKMTTPTVPTSASTRNSAAAMNKTRFELDRSAAMAAAIAGWKCGGGG